MPTRYFRRPALLNLPPTSTHTNTHHPIPSHSLPIPPGLRAVCHHLLLPHLRLREGRGVEAGSGAVQGDACRGVPPQCGETQVKPPSACLPGCLPSLWVPTPTCCGQRQPAGQHGAAQRQSVHCPAGADEARRWPACSSRLPPYSLPPKPLPSLPSRQVTFNSLIAACAQGELCILHAQPRLYRRVHPLLLPAVAIAYGRLRPGWDQGSDPVPHRLQGAVGSSMLLQHGAAGSC